MGAAGEQQQVVGLHGRRGPLRDAVFFLVLGGLSSCFVLLIVLLLAADLSFTSPQAFTAALQKPEIQAAFRLTMLTCTLAAVLSVWVATPLGYLLSRFRFPGSRIVDVLVDIPIVLPPLVLGLSLLILFHQPFPLTRWFGVAESGVAAGAVDIGEAGRPAGWILEDWLEESAGIPVTYRWPAVVLAQFAVSCTLRCGRCE